MKLRGSSPLQAPLLSSPSSRGLGAVGASRFTDACPDGEVQGQRGSRSGRWLWDPANARTSLRRTGCRVSELLPICCAQSDAYWPHNHGASTSTEGWQRWGSIVSNILEREAENGWIFTLVLLSSVCLQHFPGCAL